MLNWPQINREGEADVVANQEQVDALLVNLRFCKLKVSFFGVALYVAARPSRAAEPQN
jgi:hypothetical protein